MLDRCENAIFAGRSGVKEERTWSESEGCGKRVGGVGERGAANAKCLEGWSARVCSESEFLRITREGGIFRPWFGFAVECGGQELSNGACSMAVGGIEILGEGGMVGRKREDSGEKGVVWVEEGWLWVVWKCVEKKEGRGVSMCGMGEIGSLKKL